MTDPMRVSVVVPTYNASGRLKLTIESVLRQTAPPLEIIVVDDGSTDDTRQICATFGSAIRYVSIPNGGQQRARNIGVEHAEGDWIALLDHDDLWAADYLAELREFNERHTFDLIFCNSQTAREDLTGTFMRDGTRFNELAPAGYWESLKANSTDRWTVLDRYGYAQFLAFHPVQPSVLTIRKALFETLGGFDPRMRGRSAEDFEFELRAIRLARVGLIWRPLVTITRHPGNASVDGSKMAIDVIHSLQFALEHHHLSPVEAAAVQAEIQRRLPSAMDGAFSLRRFPELRNYRRMLSESPGLKVRIKCGIAQLPGPLARLCAHALTRGAPPAAATPQHRRAVAAEGQVGKSVGDDKAYARSR